MKCLKFVSLSVLLSIFAFVLVGVYGAAFLGVFTNHLSNFIVARTIETNAIAIRTGSTIVESTFNGIVAASAKAKGNAYSLLYSYPALVAPSRNSPSHAYNMSLTTLRLSEIVEFQTHLFHVLQRLLTGLPVAAGLVDIFSRNRWRAACVPLVKKADGEFVIGGGMKVRPTTDLVTEEHYLLELWVPYMRTQQRIDMYLLRNCKYEASGEYILKDYYVDDAKSEAEFNNPTGFPGPKPSVLWGLTPPQLEAYCRAFIPRIIRRNINTLETVDVTLDYASNVPLYRLNGGRLTAAVIDLAFPPVPTIRDEMQVYTRSDMFKYVIDSATNKPLNVNSILDTLNAHERWTGDFLVPNGGRTPYLGYAMPMLPIGYNRTAEGIEMAKVVLAWVGVQMNMDAFADVLERSNAKPTDNSKMYILDAYGSIVVGGYQSSGGSNDGTAGVGTKLTAVTLPVVWPSFVNTRDPPLIARCLNFSGVNSDSAFRTHPNVSSVDAPMIELLCYDDVEVARPSSDPLRVVWAADVTPVLQRSARLNNWEDFVPISVAVSKSKDLILGDTTADFVSVKRLLTISGEPSRPACLPIDVEDIFGEPPPPYQAPNGSWITPTRVVDMDTLMQSCPFDDMGRSIPYFLASVVPNGDVLRSFVKEMINTIIIVVCSVAVCLLGIGVVLWLIFGQLNEIAKKMVEVARSKETSYVERLSRITEIRNVQSTFISLVERLRETDYAEEDAAEFEALAAMAAERQQLDFAMQQAEEEAMQQHLEGGGHYGEGAEGLGYGQRPPGLLGLSSAFGGGEGCVDERGNFVQYTADGNATNNTLVNNTNNAHNANYANPLGYSEEDYAYFYANALDYFCRRGGGGEEAEGLEALATGGLGAWGADQSFRSAGVRRRTRQNKEKSEGAARDDRRITSSDPFTISGRSLGAASANLGATVTTAATDGVAESEAEAAAIDAEAEEAFLGKLLASAAQHQRGRSSAISEALARERLAELEMRCYRNASLLGIGSPHSHYLQTGAVCVRLTFAPYRIDPMLGGQRALLKEIYALLSTTFTFEVGAGEAAQNRHGNGGAFSSREGTNNSTASGGGGGGGRAASATAALRPEAFVHSVDATSITVLFFPLEALRQMFPLHYRGAGRRTPTNTATHGHGQQRGGGGPVGGSTGHGSGAAEAASRAFQFALAVQTAVARRGSAVGRSGVCFATMDCDPSAVVDVSALEANAARLSRLVAHYQSVVRSAAKAADNVAAAPGDSGSPIDGNVNGGGKAGSSGAHALVAVPPANGANASPNGGGGGAANAIGATQSTAQSTLREQQRQKRLRQVAAAASAALARLLAPPTSPPPFDKLIVFANAAEVTRRIAPLQTARLESPFIMTDRAASLVPPFYLAYSAPVDCVEMYCSAYVLPPTGGPAGSGGAAGSGQGGQANNAHHHHHNAFLGSGIASAYSHGGHGRGAGDVVGGGGLTVCGYTEADLPALMASVEPLLLTTAAHSPSPFPTNTAAQYPHNGFMPSATLAGPSPGSHWSGAGMGIGVSGMGMGMGGGTSSHGGGAGGLVPHSALSAAREMTAAARGGASSIGPGGPQPTGGVGVGSQHPSTIASPNPALNPAGAMGMGIGAPHFSPPIPMPMAPAVRAPSSFRGWGGAGGSVSMSDNGSNSHRGSSIGRRQPSVGPNMALLSGSLRGEAVHPHHSTGAGLFSNPPRQGPLLGVGGVGSAIVGTVRDTVSSSSDDEPTKEVEGLPTELFRPCDAAEAASGLVGGAEIGAMGKRRRSVRGGARGGGAVFGANVGPAAGVGVRGRYPQQQQHQHQQLFGGRLFGNASPCEAATSPSASTPVPFGGLGCGVINGGTPHCTPAGRPLLPAPCALIDAITAGAQHTTARSAAAEAACEAAGPTAAAVGGYVVVRCLLLEVNVLSPHVPDALLQQAQQGFRMLLTGNYAAASAFLEPLSANLAKVATGVQRGSIPLAIPLRSAEGGGMTKGAAEASAGGGGGGEEDDGDGDEDSEADEDNADHMAMMLRAQAAAEVLRVLKHVGRWKRIASANMSSRAPYARREANVWTTGRKGGPQQ